MCNMKKTSVHKVEMTNVFRFMFYAEFTRTSRSVTPFNASVCSIYDLGYNYLTVESSLNKGSRCLIFYESIFTLNLLKYKLT
jgi:hypothetical protein